MNVLSIGREVRLNRRMIAHFTAAERLSHVVHDGVDVLFVVHEEFPKSGAEVRRVGAAAGVAILVLDAACKDLLFEAVELTRNALEVEQAAESGGHRLLSRERVFELSARNCILEDQGTYGA